MIPFKQRMKKNSSCNSVEPAFGFRIGFEGNVIVIDV